MNGKLHRKITRINYVPIKVEVQIESFLKKMPFPFQKKERLRNAIQAIVINIGLHNCGLRTFYNTLFSNVSFVVQPECQKQH